MLGQIIENCCVNQELSNVAFDLLANKICWRTQRRKKNTPNVILALWVPNAFFCRYIYIYISKAAVVARSVFVLTYHISIYVSAIDDQLDNLGDFRFIFAHFRVHRRTSNNLKCDPPTKLRCVFFSLSHNFQANFIVINYLQCALLPYALYVHVETRMRKGKKHTLSKVNIEKKSKFTWQSSTPKF